ncbi:MAG: hypothetical protein Q8S56_06230, partial [Polaromonas sp.]|nr:hypothetical protein [Polaromonas sp.]
MYHLRVVRLGLCFCLASAVFQAGAQAPATTPAIPDPAAASVTAAASAPEVPVAPPVVAAPPAAAAPSVTAPAPTVPAPLTHPSLVASDTINGADTAWMMTSTALVLLMTLPGIALFYGGMVRKKNVLNTMASV